MSRIFRVEITDEWGEKLHERTVTAASAMEAAGLTLTRLIEQDKLPTETRSVKVYYGSILVVGGS